MAPNAILTETGYARAMRHTLTLVLLFAACGGGSVSEPAAPPDQTSTGGEVADAELPLEAYLSPSLDFVSIDLDQIRRHPFVSEMLDQALAALDESADPRDAELAELARRTKNALIVASLEEAVGLVDSALGWIFVRGEYGGFSPSSVPAERLLRRGDHTLVISRTGEPEVPVGDPAERLDAAVVVRANIGDAARANLARVPARATVETAERLRLRVALGDVISIQAALEHRDAAGAQRSIDELNGLLARVRPFLFVAPKPIRRIAEKLVLRREDNAVVAQLDLTAQDIRELGELALKTGIGALLEAGDEELGAP
jgi:hypothetical protein